MRGKEVMTVRKICRHLSIIVTVMLVLFAFPRPLIADGGYQIIIDDGEDLLTDSEEMQLREKMSEIAQYGNVAFVSVSQYDDTAAYAERIYRSYFGKDSGMLFMIDMGRRNIWIFCDGAIYRVINKAYANTITDNIYRLASSGLYYDCAYEAFDQAATLLAGGRIAQPMKYISNILIALVSALLINFVILILQRHNPEFEINDTAKAMTAGVAVAVLSKEKTRTRRHIHVESDGGGSSGGGGGGGGGGGSSGGGGGHSF